MAMSNRVSRVSDFSIYKNNPCISYANGNLFSPDPRIPSAIKETSTVKDQKTIREAYESSPRNIGERIGSGQEKLDLNYSSIRGAGATKARVTIKLGNKPMKMMTEIGQVISTNVKNDVCTTYSEGYPIKTVELAHDDYEGIISKTNWEIVLGARSIETKENDGEDHNPLNYPMLQFFQQLRKFEQKIVQEIATKMIENYDSSKKKAKFLPELSASMAMKTALASGNVSEVVDVIFKDHFVPLVRQAKLSTQEVETISTEYEKLTGELPEDENLQVLFGSDKITMKTKQWYRADPGFKMDKYTAYAKEVAVNTSHEWSFPHVFAADGGGEIPLKDISVSNGDAVACQFTPAFLVYETGNVVKCGFTAQWTGDLLYYRKKKEYQPKRTGGFNKRLKLNATDIDMMQEKAQEMDELEAGDGFEDQY